MRLIKLFIPTKDKYGNKINHVEMLKITMAIFSILFGGATIYQGTGISVDENMKAITENVFVVESYVGWHSVRKYKGDIEKLAKMIRCELNQNGVAYIIGSKLFIV